MSMIQADPDAVLSISLLLSPGPGRASQAQAELAVAQARRDGVVLPVGLWRGADAEEAARELAADPRALLFVDGFERLALLALADAAPAAQTVLILRDLYRRAGKSLGLRDAPRDAMGRAGFAAARLAELGPLPVPEAEEDAE